MSPPAQPGSRSAALGTWWMSPQSFRCERLRSCEHTLWLCFMTNSSRSWLDAGTCSAPGTTQRDVRVPVEQVDLTGRRFFQGISWRWRGEVATSLLLSMRAMGRAFQNGHEYVAVMHSSLSTFVLPSSAGACEEKSAIARVSRLHGELGSNLLQMAQN